jgi:D-xylose transport system substrate-binding protein
MSRRHTTRALAVLATLIFAVALAACGSDDNNDSSSSGGGGGGKSGAIALLLPETKTARYETQDRPLFQKFLKAECPDCELIYSNADQDAAKQQQQAEAALTKGAKVLVLDPVDAASAASIVTKAKQQNVPVISYDRLVSNAELDYYISFDSIKVGQLQGKSLVDKMGNKGNIVMINGAPTDNNAKLFKQGAHSVIDKSGAKVAKEYDTPDWSPDKAQQEMEQAITALGKSGIQGSYNANDGTAGGAIAAMKGNGIDPKTVPSTGQDAEVAGIQRILSGEQFVDVYKPVKPEAQAAAKLAVALLRGEDAPAGLINEQTDNGQGKVPSVIIPVVAVTKDNVKDTVIKDGYWKASDICTAAFAKFCKEAGIS